MTEAQQSSILAHMSKDICPDCGRDRNMVGRAHRCVPIPGWTKQVADFICPEPAPHEPPGEPTGFTPPPKSKGAKKPKKPIEPDDDIAIKRLAFPEPDTSIKAARAAMDRIEEKFGAAQKLTVRLPRGLIKQLKLASVEESLTIERIVELALTGWIEDRT